MPAQTTLVYGRSGTGKTSSFRFLAEFVYRKYGKISRFITADGGSRWEPLADFVDAGFIEPLLLPIDPIFRPDAIMRKLRRGAWPKGGVIFQGMKKDDWVEWTPKDAERVGAIGCESLVSISTGLMRTFAELNITKGSGDAPGLRTVEGETFASNTQGHYGDAQAEILGLLDTFPTIPGLEHFFVTSTEDIGEDDMGMVKRTVVGPASVGKKLASVIPSKVGDCIHLVSVEDEATKKREIRAYVVDHADAQSPKTMWPAKVRLVANASALAEFRKKWPLGFFVLTPEKGIGELLSFKDQMAAQMTGAAADLRARLDREREAISA